MKKLALICFLFPVNLFAGQQEVADSLKAIDREIVRFRYFATAGALGFMNVDGTLPDGGTGVRFNITSFGSAASDQTGVKIILNDGYTGTNPSYGLFIANNNFGASGGGGGIGLFVRSGSQAPRVSIYAGYGNTPAVPQNSGALFYGDMSGVAAPAIFIGASGTTVRYTVASSGDIIFGNAAGIASPVSRSISGEPGLGADKVGGNITIHSGIGTGAGSPSSFQILTPEAHGSDSTAQTEIISFSRSQKSYSMGDAADVALFTVILPTNDTGCAANISVSYQAAGGGNVVSHAGIITYSFVNNAGTVTGTGVESGESITGTGCAAGCDTYPVTAAGTTATAKANFNNTLTVTGALRYQLVSNTCQSWVRQ